MGGNQVCPHRTIRSSATSQFKKNAETPVIAPRYSVGAMTETLTHITITPSDMLMFAAVAMLPFDGTKIGIPLPYWTPISPWLFTLYTIINWRYLRDTARRFLPFFLFPLLLVLTSVYGWQSYGIHASATAKSFISILLGLACLASLDIAIRIKRVPVRTLLTTLFTAYVVAFLIGIL